MHRIAAFIVGVTGMALTVGASAAGIDWSKVDGFRESARVVFVCEHGSVKSLIAMNYFNRRAQERGLEYRAVARGTAPETTVPSSVREGLRGDGFVVSGFVPRLFTATDVHEASLVVSFDQDVAKIVGGRARHLRWDNLPGVLADYGRGRDEIVRHVDELIDELARSSSPWSGPRTRLARLGNSCGIFCA